MKMDNCLENILKSLKFNFINTIETSLINCYQFLHGYNETFLSRLYCSYRLPADEQKTIKVTSCTRPYRVLDVFLSIESDPPPPQVVENMKI